jgi:hypothetical protein
LNDPLPGGITSEHRYDLPLSREAVWELISDMDAYRTWWSWLRTFDADGLKEGEEWSCTIQPPLPYLVRFWVHIEQIDEFELVRARVTGDVIGTATLKIEEKGTGCQAKLSSTLAPGNSMLRVVSRVAAPIARFGHDWVLDSGARQFIARAITPTVAD